MTHRIKIMESFADAVLRGDKTFEVRNNDRGYQCGDMVQFTVLYDSDGLEILSHPLNKKNYRITYVLSGWGIQDGYVVFGIKPVKDNDCADCELSEEEKMSGGCQLCMAR